MIMYEVTKYTGNDIKLSRIVKLENVDLLSHQICLIKFCIQSII